MLGVVFQARTLDLDLSITQNLVYHAALHGIRPAEAVARSKELLSRIALTNRMLISSAIKQLENFAGVMNFVIFPMFFASSALYPLWGVQETSPLLYHVCQFNPFSHAVELIRFSLYGKINWLALAVVCVCAAVFMLTAILAYEPSRGLALS